MAGIKQQCHCFDPKRTVVVLNVPSSLRKAELTIHFQKSKYGGGDVNEVVVDGNVAFVTFDSAEDAIGVLNHPKQTIDDNKVQLEKYETWLAEKKREESAATKEDDSHRVDEENGVKTVYVSGIKQTTTEDLICLYFENKRRTGGGELCEGKEGYKRISPTVARLTFLHCKDVQNILLASNDKPIVLDGNTLSVTTELEPTHDRSILLVKNISPSTSKETLKDFVEATKHADVFNVVLGKDGKAIVILRSEIDEDSSEDETSSTSEKLDGSIISMEFAPLTKGIRISNIPQETTSDSIKFKFSNPKIGGGKVTDITVDRNNGVANVHFEKSSVVSALGKKSHKIKNVSLTVIPYYDEFEELQKVQEVKKSEFSGEYQVEPFVMDYIFNHQEIEKEKFNFKSMKYDQAKSCFHFTKEYDDLKTKFQNDLKEFLHSFVKEEVKIPKNILKKIKETIESNRDGFDSDTVDFIFEQSNISFVGKKQDIAEKKQMVEEMIDQFTEEANVETKEIVIEEKNKLKFMNFIAYFKKLNTDFPGITIHGTDSPSGKLSLVGRAEKIKDIQLRILQDLMKISEIDVPLSDRQIGFLKSTDCKIVNDELNKDDAMLMLIDVKGKVWAKALQARIFCWKKDNKEKKLSDIVISKTTEKCVKVDEETAKVLARSEKLREFKKEKFDKQQVLIDQELTDPCKIWIVCENSKMMNAEQELTSLTDEKKISSQTLKPMDRMKVRFLNEHCFSEIKAKKRSLEKEGVFVTETDSDSFQVTGTPAGRKDMILFLEQLAGDVYFKAYPLNEPGMKKQMSSETTDAIISRVEKDYRCVIERESQPVRMFSKDTDRTRFNVFGRSERGAKTTSGGGDGGVSIKIYSDDRRKFDKAWGELKRKMNENIKEQVMTDDVIKKFTDGHVETLRELERRFDVKIKVEQSKGKVTIKGHISDISIIQEKIRKILKEITEKESSVPDTWDNTLAAGVFQKVKLSTRSKEYKDIETAFRKTAPSQIVCIERIQNKEIYELYNVKRKAMIAKYGSNFTGKELMLFHGASRENIEKINAGGLNRSYAGIHATAYGRGVYFARDASYSCHTIYSPPDPQGLRYIYYARVLVGEYTVGNSSMIVAPPKNAGDPSETFDSVVDNPANPSMYVMFQDYEYYSEYLITFR